MENRLRAARKARRLTQGQLAQRAETTLQQISRLERGERRMTIDWVQRLARALGCPVAEILGPTLEVSALDSVTVKGAVEAGAWRDAPGWPDAEHYPAPVPEDPRHAGVARFGLEVRGASLDRRYPAGSILIGVALADLDGLPAPGKLVICRRRDAKGRVEVTARELRRDAAGRDWLWLDSNDPGHQQPIPAEEVEITALVTGGYRPE